VAWTAADRTFPRRDTDHIAALEMDLGVDHPVGIGYKAQSDPAEFLGPVSQVLAVQGADLLRPSDDTGVDLIPLAAMGLPTFAPIQDSRTYFDYHHSAADTFDKIRPAELRENTALAAVLAYALANLEPAPPHAAVRLLPGWLREQMAKIEAQRPSESHQR
jgi:carboxypeptidase Q